MSQYDNRNPNHPLYEMLPALSCTKTCPFLGRKGESCRRRVKLLIGLPDVRPVCICGPLRRPL